MLRATTHSMWPLTGCESRWDQASCLRLWRTFCTPATATVRMAHTRSQPSSCSVLTLRILGTSTHAGCNISLCAHQSARASHSLSQVDSVTLTKIGKQFGTCAIGNSLKYYCHYHMLTTRWQKSCKILKYHIWIYCLSLCIFLFSFFHCLEPDSTLWYIAVFGFIIVMIGILIWLVPQFVNGKRFFFSEIMLH